MPARGSKRLRQWRFALPVVALTATAGVFAAAPSAGANLIPGLTGQIGAGVGVHLCVTSTGDALDSPVVIDTCNGDSPAQTWTIEDNGTIQNNGMCLDINQDSRANKALVQLWTCTGRANQVWEPFLGKGVTMQPGIMTDLPPQPELMLVNPQSGKCLDDPQYSKNDGTQLIIFTCHDGANQTWTLPTPDV
jgi:hypothetical protein